MSITLPNHFHQLYAGWAFKKQILWNYQNLKFFLVLLNEREIYRAKFHLVYLFRNEVKKLKTYKEKIPTRPK